MASDDDVLNILKQVTQSKAAKPVQSKVAPIVRRDSAEIQGLLGQLDKNPYRKPGTVLPQPEAKPYYATGELSDIMDQFKSPKGIAGVLAGGVEILDISKRAVISGAREFADTWDMNPETKASFSDWKRQTLDKGFGYGRAFPISNKTMLGRWAGRATGLIGDLIFDPVNWATLGGAIPIKGVIKFTAKEFAEMAAKEAAEGAAKKMVVKKVLENGDVLVRARSVLGKNVIGRDGRAALGRFTKKRLTALRNAGEEGYKDLTDDVITDISAKVYSDGKRVFVKHPNLPAGFAESIGVRGPGIYYFGSRLKVPGTTTIGRLSEDVITDLRLFLSNTKAGKAVRTATTGTGVGRIMRMGTKGIDDKTGEDVILNPLRKARVDLADGSLTTPAEREAAMMVVELHDFHRLRTVVHLDTEQNKMAQVADEFDEIENGYRYLDGVTTAELEARAASGDVGSGIALKVRKVMEYLHARANMRSQAVGGTAVPFNPKYFPHLETEAAKQERLLLGNDAFDAMMYGDDAMEPLARNQIPKSDRRTVFNERELIPGKKWFGVELTEADITIDRLNAIARASGKVNFDIFETNTTKVLAGYLQQYADQMGWFDALEYGAREYPNFLSFGETLMKISPTYANEMMKTRPNQMFRALEAAIRKHSLFLDNSLTSVRNELIAKHGSLDTALIAMREGTMSATELDDLLKALNEQIAVAEGLEGEYQRILAEIGSQLENRDGVSGFNLFFEGIRSVKLSESFEKLKSLVKELDTSRLSWREGEAQMAKFVELFEAYSKYAEELSVLSRDVEFSSLVSDVFPGLNNVGQYGAAQQYDIFAKIINELGQPDENTSARLWTRGWGPDNPYQFRDPEYGGWSQSAIDGVRRLTIDDINAFLDDVAQMDIDQLEVFSKEIMSGGKGHHVARWLQALIVENEKLAGGGEELVRGFLDDARTNFKIGDRRRKNPYDFGIVDTTNPNGTFNQWKSAIKSLRAGDVAPFEDLLIQQRALSTIYKWQEMYAPFGIQIGDDVVDEIVQREARDYALKALRNGDQRRFDYLTSAKFGRDGGTGPLGTHRLIERQRQIFADMMELHGFNVREGKYIDGTPIPEATKKVAERTLAKKKADFLKTLSDSQRAQWLKAVEENEQVLAYVDSRIEFITNARNSIKNAGELQSRWDFISERFEKAFKFIESGELFNISNNVANDSTILFDDLVTEMYEIAKQIGDAARLSQDPIAARAIEDNWNSFIDEMATQLDRTRFILNNYSPESKIYKEQKFVIKSIVEDAMLRELDSTKTIFFSEFNSSIDAMSDEMLRLVRMRKQSTYVLNNPEEYFRIGPGSLDSSVDESILAAPRSLDEGGKVVDARTGELISPTSQELDVIITNYRNSEQMPIARAAENNANRAHSLVHVDLSKMRAENMPGGVTFTDAEWDRIVHGGAIETGSPKFDAFLKALRAQRGGQVSDDKLIDDFVDYVLTNFRDTDAVVKHNKVVAYRRKQILSNWKKSEHYSWLQDYRTYEQRKFAKAFAANAADEVRQLDAASNAITFVRNATDEVAVDVPVFTAQRKNLLQHSFNKFISTMRKMEKTIQKPESKIAFVEEVSGDIQRVADKRIKPIVQDVDEVAGEADDTIETLMNESLKPSEKKWKSGGVNEVESRTFLGRDGVGKEVADYEALPITGLSGVDETLIITNRETAKVVDSFLSGSNIEKSTQQLEKEIGILESMIKNNLNTPWTTGKSKRALVRLRKAEIAKREGFVVTPAGSRPKTKWTYSSLPIDDFESAIEFVKRVVREEKLVLANAKHVERLKRLLETAAYKSEGNLTPDLENAVTAVTGRGQSQAEKMLKAVNSFIDSSLKKRNGKYNRSLTLKPEDIEYYTARLSEPDFDYEIDELVELEDLHSAVNWKKFSDTEMVAVPKDVAPVATDVPMDAAAKLQAQLEALGKSSTTEKERIGKEASDARAVADKLQAKYDVAQAAADGVDEDQVKYLQNRIEVLQRLIDGTEIDVRAGRGKQSTFDYSDGISLEYTKHQEAKRFLEYANSVLSLLGAKVNGEFDQMDAILRAQLASEAEVHLAVANLKSAQHDRLMLDGVQKMIDGGGRLLPDGRVQLSTGLIVDGVPTDAVVDAGKAIRTGWDSISKNFPDLYGSPEMVELLGNAARFEDPEFVRKMAYYIGPYTKLFKAFAVLSPGFHVRNGLANAVQFALAGVEMDNATLATRMYYRWLKASKEGKSWNEFIVSLDEPMQEVMKTARNGSIGSGGGIYSEVMKEASGSRVMDWWLIRKNYALGQQSDNYSRFVLAFDSAMKGNDQFMAAARVKRFYFDYEDLSTLDKVMKQFIPFWLFYSRNLHTQITNMWLNPRPYHIYYNIKNNISDREEPNPPFVEEMGGFRLPFGDGLYMMPDFGFTRVQKELTDLTNPMKMIPKMNPLFVVPFEQITGRDSYSGKKFEGVDDRLLNALTSIAPPAQQFDKLITNDNPMSKLNAWLGYMGSPIRKYN